MTSLTTAIVFFENSVGRVVLEPAGYIRLQWLGAPRAAGLLRAVLGQLLRAQLRTGFCRLLIDERAAAAFSPADQAWLVEEWLPASVTCAGQHYAAHLTAADVFARLAGVTMVEKARRLGFQHQLFQHEADALHWLSLQPATLD